MIASESGTEGRRAIVVFEILRVKAKWRPTRLTSLQIPPKGFTSLTATVVKELQLLGKAIVVKRLPLAGKVGTIREYGHQL
uniref:Uncharacterized protein n=1 Tax=Parascaris univalens TaxID=6257 RepID=A0A915A4C0_PARUN